MKKQKEINLALAGVLVFGILAMGLIFFIGVFTSCEVEVNGQIADIKVNRTVKNNCPIACTPCVDEPQFEKCEFTSFAYQALVDKKDIYGQYELKKGDIYYFENAFYYDFDSFCTKTPDENGNSNCYDEKLILDKKLFKPIK
jgi:hypothetical protein